MVSSGLLLLLLTTAAGQLPLPPLDTTTTLPSTTPLVSAQGDVVADVSAGQLAGLRFLVKDVPWLPGRDPSEEQPDSHGRNEISPVRWKNDVVVYGFLGIPYAYPPVTARRFKVKMLACR